VEAASADGCRDFLLPSKTLSMTGRLRKQTVSILATRDTERSDSSRARLMEALRTKSAGSSPSQEGRFSSHRCAHRCLRGVRSPSAYALRPVGGGALTNASSAWVSARPEALSPAVDRLAEWPAGALRAAGPPGPVWSRLVPVSQFMSRHERNSRSTPTASTTSARCPYYYINRSVDPIANRLLNIPLGHVVTSDEP
jgi:hypothetical protein